MPVLPYWIVTSGGLRDTVDGLAAQSDTMLPGVHARSARDSCGNASTAAWPAAVKVTAEFRPGPPPVVGAGRLGLGRAARARNLPLTFRHTASLERVDAAQRRQRAVASGRIRHDQLLGRPVVGEVRLTARQPGDALDGRFRR